MANVVASGRRATGAFFALVGVSVSTWAALVPFTKARLGLDDGTLGTVLLALSWAAARLRPTLIRVRVFTAFRLLAAALLAPTLLLLVAADVHIAVLIFHPRPSTRARLQ